MLIALALVAALMLAFAGQCFAASVCLSPQKLTVDGKGIDCEKYNIDGSNYFKLRDLAYLLNGTGSQFSVGWNDQTKTVSITTGKAYTADGSELKTGTDKSKTAQISAQTILINGKVRSDLSVYNIGGNNFFKLRDLGTALGFFVSYDAAADTAVVKSVAKFDPDTDPVSLNSASYTLASGTVSANVVTVNLCDPRVHIEVQHVDSTLNHTALFSDIVAANSPDVAVNANFFNAYDEVKDPIGMLMSNGEFVYCDYGLPSLGFTEDNEARWGVPSVFTRLRAGGKQWAAYTVNTPTQGEYDGILYTPARGASISITASGYVLTAKKGVITSYAPVSAGATVTIPANGFVMFMGTKFVSTDYFRTPVVGDAITVEPYLRVAEEEGFVLDGVKQIVSGAPRLVKDGKICTELIPGFEEARFTTASTPRTAVGTTADGKLLIVNVTSATIQQMRELMLKLGCVDATNLDGGASTGMYYRGKFIATPGRELTSTLQISVR